MKKIIILVLCSICLYTVMYSQNVICFTEETSGWSEIRANLAMQGFRTVNDPKTVRVNYHFMLRTNGSGNFTETNDGDGRSFSGYDYAREQTLHMNIRNSWNEQMNIPTGNNTPVNPKNYRYVLDAVYFHRNDTTYEFTAINSTNYLTLGQDRDSVLNIFLTYDFPDSTKGGYASSVSPTSKVKYTENRGYWQEYRAIMRLGLPYEWHLHGTNANTIHEIGHLLGLAHTVRYPGAGHCRTNCPNLPGGTPIDLNCDDGCNDTPTAWAIAQANNCTRHPACGFGNGSLVDCSNNLMDYSGSNALTPCQIGIIHSSLEGGMKSYTSCAATSVDKAYCDVGYPKLSYFGKILTIGCSSTAASITAGEKVDAYFSNSLLLNNIEISSSANFEVILEPVCNF